MLLNAWEYLIANREGIEIALKTGTFFISVFTLVGALIGGLYSVGSMTSDRKSRQLTEFIMLFSNENALKRLSGINGLSRYSKCLFKELFFICSIEKEAIIRELIYDALQKESRHKKSQCIWINDFLVSCLLQQDCQDSALVCIKNETELISKLKRSQTERRIQYEIKKRNPSGAFEANYAIDNHMLLSSKLLAVAVTNSLHIKMNGNLIMQSNMYGSKWICNSIRNCAIVSNVARHMLSLFTKYYDCSILGNNYLGSRFVRTYFTKCTIRDCVFRGSSMLYSVISGGRMERTRFNESSLKQCIFTGIAAIEMCGWNGCTIENSEYRQTKIVANEMKGTNFMSVAFTDVSLWRNTFIGSFTKCRFQNVKWGGTALKGVHFIDCIFDHTDFSGARPVNCKFIGCRFIHTDTAKMSSGNTSFENCRDD